MLVTITKSYRRKRRKVASAVNIIADENGIVVNMNGDVKKFRNGELSSIRLKFAEYDDSFSDDDIDAPPKEVEAQ